MKSDFRSESFRENLVQLSLSRILLLDALTKFLNQGITKPRLKFNLG